MSILKVDELQSRTSGNRITLPDVNNYPPYRNLIINGDMSIAQRGTSSAGITTSGYYTVDRWRTGISTGGTWTQSQDTDVPTGQGLVHSTKLDCTTANASLSGGEIVYFTQRFEGQNLQFLKYGTSNAESLTLSFWVKSNKTGTYIVELLNQDSTRNITNSYTINTANTWEKKTLTFAGDSTGTYNDDNNRSLDLNFWLVAGTNYTSGTSATSWGTTVTANRAAGQTVNLADNTANDWYITGVQLEVGDSATPFEHLPYDVNYSRCLRYYWKTDQFAVLGRTFNTANASIRVTAFTPVPMRAIPSCTWLSSGNDWRGNSSACVASTTITGININNSKTTIRWDQAHISGSMVSNTIWHHASSGVLDISSEL